MKITNEDNIALMARYPDNYFDLAIVDPPYGGNDAIGLKDNTNNGKQKANRTAYSVFDNIAPSSDYFNELKRVSKNQIIWGGNYFGLEPTRCFLIWDKQQPEGVSFASCEYSWTSFNQSAKTFYMRPQNADNVRIHPTQKPVKLYEWLLMNYAKEGDKILDTHLGSGSIALACHNLGFDLTACELDEDYYNDAMKRIETHKKQITLF